MKHPDLPRLKSFSALTRRRRLIDHGQAMVEFAFMFPILVLILMGTVDLGHGIYAYGVVSSAAREGARYGTTNHEENAITHDLTVTIPQIAKANTIPLDQSRITVNAVKACLPDPNPCGGGIGTIQVTVTYQFQPLTLFFAPLTLTGKSTMFLE